MSDTKFIRDRRFFEQEMTDQVAEVRKDDVQPLTEPAPRQLGKPVDRYDGYNKLSASAQFTVDRKLPHMLVARTLRCPHPHAQIRAINSSAAEKLRGVVAILHHDNAPPIPWYADSLLFDTHLRYQGEEVAVVAAETEAIANEALSLIQVEYEILPFETRTMEAYKEGAPVYHEEGSVVNGQPSTGGRGDVDAAFASADAIVEGEFKTAVDIHNPLEPHNSVVFWKGSELTVYDSTQGVFNIRNNVAAKLQIPASSVKVIAPAVGGGFGSKLAEGKYTVMAALLAKETGRPVSIALDRKEMNLAVGNRPDSVQRLKASAMSDGTLTAFETDSYGTGGAQRNSAWMNWPFLTLYQCPNLRYTHRSIYTNLGPARPFRAPGHPQGTFALDQMIDMLAEKIGMDPLAFRKHNIAEIDQVSGRPYTSKKLLECYERGAAAIGWTSRRNTQPGTGSGPVKRGIGMASQIWWGGGGPPAGVTVTLNHDGSLDVKCGSQDMGTGTFTILQQTVGEVMQVPLSKIHVTVGETANAPFAPLSGGSQTAPSITPAAYVAAMDIKSALMDALSVAADVPADSLTYADGTITGAEESWTLPEAMNAIGEQTLVRTGMRPANPEGMMVQTFGAQFAEVEVDIETGEVTVKKIVAAHDIGRPLNQKLLENQFHGGIMQGIGMALMEERVVDHNLGKVVSTNLHDYKMPTIKDAPEIEVIVADNIDTTANNLGVKGIGEPPIIPTAGAIANAVYNATGVRMHELPMTPDRVLMALLDAPGRNGQ
jgi:xanthine dehydrogenase YagR molybdenum-binding subunit